MNKTFSYESFSTTLKEKGGGGRNPKNGGKYYWIIFPNELVKAIAERNV